MPPNQRIALLTALVESERSIADDPRFGAAAQEIIRNAERELASLVAAAASQSATATVAPHTIG